MYAFDTDILSGILRGNADFVSKAGEIPVDEQYIPIIVVEEIMRGRMNIIRRAEAGKVSITIDRAYELFQATFTDFQRLQILPYTTKAELIYKGWREQKVRVGTHDMRIGAICVAHRATLVSRNRRDFERIPDLCVEFWG